VSTAAAALAAGILAGLGVALPLGAIGVLLLREGLARGWRPAAAGATGIALVDLGYACAALLAGAAVSRTLAGHTRTVQLTGAVVLTAVAGHGLVRMRSARAETWTGPDQPDRPGSPLRVAARFVGLTAVNPLTAIYFVVLTTGLSDTVRGTLPGAAFATGVFLASWSWQLVLAGAGSLAGARLPGWARWGAGVTGYLVVLGYAVRLATG
jgi:arginine exporter protein ArgO